MANIRKSYSLEEEEVQAISVLAAERGVPESRIIQKYINDGLRNDILCLPSIRHVAALRIIDMKISQLMKVLEIDVQGSRRYRIYTFIAILGIKYAPLEQTKEENLAILSLFEILKLIYDVDEKEYAAIEKSIKSHRRLYKLFNNFRRFETSVEDTLKNTAKIPVTELNEVDRAMNEEI